MNCCQAQQIIEETPSTELLHNNSGAAVEHLRRCQTCRSFRDNQIKLQGLLDDLGRVEAPAWFDARLNERLRQAAKPRWSSRLSFAPGLPSIAVTAWCVFAIALALSIQQLTINPPPARQQPVIIGDKPSLIDTYAQQDGQASGMPQSGVESVDKSDQPSRIAVTATTSLPVKRVVSSSRTQDARQQQVRQSRLTSLASASSRLSSQSVDAAPTAMSTTTSSASRTSRSPVESILLSAQPAPTVPIALPNSANSSVTNRTGRVVIDIPPQASGRTLHIALPDAQGRMQTLSVEPLTFGANQLKSHTSKVSETESPNQKNKASKRIIDESDEVVW